MRAAILLALVLLTAGSAAAADAERVIAALTFGDGVAGDAVPVATGERVRSGERLMRVTLLDAPGSHLILRPGTELTLRVRQDGAAQRLVVALASGAVQVSIDDKGPYGEVSVVGAAVEARVVGTLFVVERARDSDYVAVVRGKVGVRLRQEVADALAGGGGEAELGARQGIAGGPDGLGSPQTLTTRPQLTKPGSVQEQGATPGGEGTWDVDEALTVIDAAPPIDSGDIVSDIAEAVSDAMADAIDAQVTHEIVLQTVGGTGLLGLPPGPP